MCNLLSAASSCVVSSSLDVWFGVAGLEEIHRNAVGSIGETREELDGLLNLIARLDYNNFLSGEPDYHALLKNPLISSYGK